MHTSLLPAGQRSSFKAIQIQIKQTHKSPGQNPINSSSWSAQLAKVPIRGYGNMVVGIPKPGGKIIPQCYAYLEELQSYFKVSTFRLILKSSSICSALWDNYATS